MRCIRSGPMSKKYGVPKVRTRCWVGRRVRDPQIDPRSVPQSSRPLQRGVPDPPQGSKWRKWPLPLVFWKILENNGSQAHLWVSWPQWTPKGGSWPEVPWGRTWAAPKCPKMATPMGTPIYPHIWREKNEKKWKEPRFLTWNQCSNLPTFQSWQKMMLWGRGVAHGGAQMWRKIWQFYHCDQSQWWRAGRGSNGF